MGGASLPRGADGDGRIGRSEPKSDERNIYEVESDRNSPFAGRSRGSCDDARNACRAESEGDSGRYEPAHCDNRELLRPHPQIREAIASFRYAKEHMEHAAHDFGGHRVEALRATDEAIQQLEVYLRYDKD